MPGPAIKICGINSDAALDAALASRADFVGLVFFAKSPRNVSLSQAAALAARAAGRTRLVGLFVDADMSFVAEAASAAKLDILQLHGRETAEVLGRVRAGLGLPVWKALSIACREDVLRAQQYADAADLVLFDAKAPKGAELPGGLGLVFDWSLLAAHRGSLPWGLAGGLSPANVADAVRSTGATLVDVSSGVESAPGVKDGSLIRSFCLNARIA